MGVRHRSNIANGTIYVTDLADALTTDTGRQLNAVSEWVNSLGIEPVVAAEAVTAIAEAYARG